MPNKTEQEPLAVAELPRVHRLLIGSELTALYDEFTHEVLPEKLATLSDKLTEPVTDQEKS